MDPSDRITEGCPGSHSRRAPLEPKGAPGTGHRAPSPLISSRRTSIKEPRVNEQIRISPIRLIDADGEQVGVVSLDKARQMASETELDMVEVAPDARPPVVRLMDYGRYRYQQQKKEKEARKNAQTVDVKEVQLRPRTEEHDFQVKLKRARGFLEDGNIVKVVVRFRGRELRRPEVGITTMDRMLDAMRDIATVEFRSNSIEGRRLIARMEPGT